MASQIYVAKCFVVQKFMVMCCMQAGHSEGLMMVAIFIAHGSIDLSAQCAKGDYR